MNARRLEISDTGSVWEVGQVVDTNVNGTFIRYSCSVDTVTHDYHAYTIEESMHVGGMNEQASLRGYHREITKYVAQLFMTPVEIASSKYVVTLTLTLKVA